MKTLGLFDLNTYFLNNPIDITANISLTLHRNAESTEKKIYCLSNKITNMLKIPHGKKFLADIHEEP